MNYKKIYTYKIYKNSNRRIVIEKNYWTIVHRGKIKKIDRDQWRIFKKKKYHQTERSFRVGENKFSPRWSRSWWTKPVVSGFIFPFEPRSRTSCVWTMHRAKKFAWMARKSGEFPSFSPWSVFPPAAHRPSSQPRNEEKQTRSTRCLSVEERKLRGTRRGAAAAVWPGEFFALLESAAALSSFFFFLFSFQRNVIGCCARGNFMKLPDFWPGSNFTKIWNSIRRRDSITRVISLRSFVNKNFRSREKLM